MYMCIFFTSSANGMSLGLFHFFSSVRYAAEDHLIPGNTHEQAALFHCPGRKSLYDVIMYYHVIV